MQMPKPNTLSLPQCIPPVVCVAVTVTLVPLTVAVTTWGEVDVGAWDDLALEDVDEAGTVIVVEAVLEADDLGVVLLLWAGTTEPLAVVDVAAGVELAAGVKVAFAVALACVAKPRRLLS